MIATTPSTDLTWRLLWSHIAHRIVTELTYHSDLELISAGYGWGLRRRDNSRIALLLHPTAGNREVGDLSLTVLGAGSHIIPRAGSAYSDYVRLVEDAVETTAHAALR